MYPARAHRARNQATLVACDSMSPHGLELAIRFWLATATAIAPNVAEGRRAEVQARSSTLMRANHPIEAAEELEHAASAWGDPLLFLAAADIYYAEAQQRRDRDLARRAWVCGSIALDVTYPQLEPTFDPNARSIAAADALTLIRRAQHLQANAQILVNQIAREQLAAQGDAVLHTKDTDQAKTGRALTIAGATVTSVAGLLLGLGAAGVALGAQHQRAAEQPTIYGDAYDEVARKGTRANILAITGFSAGAALGIAGLTLLAVGRWQSRRGRGFRAGLVAQQRFEYTGP